MSAQDNASEAPEGTDAPGPSVPLSEIYDEEFQNKMKGRATFWKNHLSKEVKAQIFENENPKYKTFLEKSGIREKWEQKMNETGDYENFDVGTLQDAVNLHADYTEFRKDIKQIEVWEKKRALGKKKDELKEATDEMGEATTKINELSQKLEELKQASEDMIAETQKIGELREKIGGIQGEIDQLDKDLYEARESRKDEDRHLVKKLKEYISELRLPEPPLAEEDEEPAHDDRSATPPASAAPESDVDSEFSQTPPPKKPSKKDQPPPPKRKGKKATVEDAD